MKSHLRRGLGGALLGGCVAKAGVALIGLAVAPLAAPIAGAAMIAGALVGIGAACAWFGWRVVRQEQKVAEAEAVHAELEAEKEAAEQEGRAVAEAVQALQEKMEKYQADKKQREDELAALQRQEAMLSEHMQTLKEFETLYSEMAAGLKKADECTDVIQSMIKFFDRREQKLLEKEGKGADDAEQMKVYIKYHLKDSSLEAWSDSVDRLEVSNGKLMDAIQVAFGMK